MQADYVLDYDVISAAREQRLYVLARIKGGPASSQQRPPLNLSVVLDRSGSMAGDKLDNVKKATQFLVQHMGSEDRFSLVTYDSYVSVDVQPGEVIYKDRINQAIQAIRSGSSTNLSGGWLQGCALVTTGLRDSQINRVLLLTDGLANEGITDSARLAALARQKREEGVTTTTIGVGMGFNEDLLTEIAREGGGAFYFIDNPDQAPTIFREELHDLLSVVGQNLVITVSPSVEVKSVTQYNSYPLERRLNDHIYRMGDLFADEIKILLLELTIPAMSTLGQIEVAKLYFEYDELAENTIKHRTSSMPITVNSVRESDYTVHKPNTEVVRTLLLLRAARAREDAVKYADSGQFDRASDVLSKAADAIRETDLYDDADLQAQHDMLREEAIDMEMGKERYDDYTRKSQTSKMSMMNDSRAVKASQAQSLHARMKSSRRALERQGVTPGSLSWKRESLRLDKDEIKIGRGQENDIVVPEEEVSKAHCRLVRENGEFFLEDLNSTNGTFANGGKVGVGKRFRVSVGDVMTVGTWFFTFGA